MITLICLLILFIIFMAVGLCFRLAGGVVMLALKLSVKLLIALPCAILCALFGILFCCTLILIPLGLGCFRVAGHLLSPC